MKGKLSVSTTNKRRVICKHKAVVAPSLEKAVIFSLDAKMYFFTRMILTNLIVFAFALGAHPVSLNLTREGVSVLRNPGNKYMLKFNNRDTRKRCEICSKSKITTLERRQWLSSGVFIVDFERISHLFLVLLLLTYLEQVNVCWKYIVNRFRICWSTNFAKTACKAEAVFSRCSAK